MSESHNIMPAHLAIHAMRDNGYKNTAYAIAELIDNSLQAGAKNIEVLCGEEEFEGKKNRIMRTSQIAILDDGVGMDKKTLRISLQFGNGTRLDPSNQKGIGKFGMGLPASSISQCTKVEVWSWQNGIENAYYTYLDLNEVKSKKIDQVPEPKKSKIPLVLKSVGKTWGQSGTLVLWTNLDRIIWRKAEAIINNSELLLGRLYRKFLDENKTKIRFVTYEVDNFAKAKEKYALPNDPIYLMKKTSCPAPFDKTAMFEVYGDKEVTFPVQYNGKKYPVKIKFSVAKKEARKGDNAGLREHGKHAARNVGISVVRADREIELDKSWIVQYDPMERWWGIELDFAPELDELFGLTNNKQYATNFAQLANFDYDEIAKSKKTIIEFKEDLEDSGDPIAPILEIGNVIKNNLRALRNLLKTQNAGTRSLQNNDFTEEDTPESIATKRTRNMIEEGFITENDKLEKLPPAERVKQVEEVLVADGLDEEDALKKSKKTIEFGLKYVFTHGDIQTPAFFTVRPKAGTIIITLNTQHPAYDKLMQVVDESMEELSKEELIEKLSSARDGLKLILEAWARYEDTLPDGQAKERAQETRNDWGKMAKRFMSEE